MEQLSNAEEHLRRAIIEPYELSINLCLSRLMTVLKDYKEHVLPRSGQTAFASCPSTTSIHAILNKIAELRSTGRTRKAKNIWDADWEEGVKAFVEAYQLARQLALQLEEYLVRVQQIKLGEETRSTLSSTATDARNASQGIKHLSWSHVVVGIVIAGLTLVVDHYVLKAGPITTPPISVVAPESPPPSQTPR